jgi:serine/threonine-protein kinase
MQFMNGRTLREALREKNHFSEEELVALAGAIGRGLRFLHNSEILHKDIKPDNIMLDNEGRVKIIDFGFASTKFGVRFGFWSRRLEGSPAYLAPELIKTKKPSEATDLYALGCTLYEAAVGVVPFAGHSDAEVLHKQTDEKLRPRPVSSINPRTSVFMEKLILNALEKDPKERYRSADEFLMELSRNPLIRRGRSTRFPAGWFREQKS